MNKVCDRCGKPYIKNSGEFLKSLPETIRKNLEWIPSCDCLEKEEREKEEKDRLEYELQLKEARGRKYKSISVVDKNFINSTFKVADLTPPHMKIVKKFAEKFSTCGVKAGLLLYGNCGTGKTFASACIANYAREHGKSVFALSLNNYLTKLQTEWGEAETEILKAVNECDLLVIDDFGSEHKKEWAISKIFALIDNRYRSGKPVIITTNLNYSDDSKICEVSKFFSLDGKDRIKDRIKEMCFPLRIEGESRRKVNKKEFLEELFS